jgi:adenosylcobinamide-GDP ribazoletransferase
MNAFYQALAFLTRLPVPPHRPSAQDWERSVAYYPLVGALMGLLLWGANLVLIKVVGQPLAGVLALVFWVYLSGGLHLDGWMDLADGLGSNRPRERILEIMKDSRVGAMGVVAAFLLLLVKWGALSQIQLTHQIAWLTLPPLLSRYLLVVAIWFWPYITANGIGTGLRKGLTRVRVLLGFLFTIGVTFGLFGWVGILVLLAGLLAAVLFIQRIARKLGGLTGDCYGALVEWTEAVLVVLIVLVGRLWM